ncbi:MAG: presqualene diphosphate synthase HpnD [Pseudolabrys sp.]
MSELLTVTEQAGPPAASRGGRSSFYFAMRILKRDQRDAMFQIYAFCREVDDIADGDAPRARRLSQLTQCRRDVDALYSGGIPAGRDRLATAINRFALRKEDFLALIEGMEMDARGDIRRPVFEELELYCDRVACAVGRLSVRVFGMTDAAGQALAHHLGLALQFTNILRDIDEDAALGRLYLPREALQLANIDETDPQAVISDPRLSVACIYLADRAREHYTKADEVMSRCSRRTVRAPKVMAEVYRRILGRLAKRGWAHPRPEVRVSKPQLLWIAARYAFG